MIHIRFRGRLGNQMFQYAAARLTAERLNCRLLIEEPAFGISHTMNQVVRGSSYYSLFKVFDHLHPGIGGHALSAFRRLSPRLADQAVKKIFPNEFRPAATNSEDREGNERFDARFFDIAKYTRMSGYYQSERYFQGHEAHVRSWYAPTSQDLAEVAQEWARSGLEPNQTIAVHVRLGDYRAQQGAAGRESEGWILPRAYYDKALASLGQNVPIALFSDEPREAREFLGREVAYISDGTNLRRDFFLMSSCKYIVTANSSFSWWAAWANFSAEKIIVGPKFHVGRMLGEWYPADIMVRDWIYV